MIRGISLAKVATFSPITPEELSDLKPLNWIFGANGSGKTTISRVIADPAYAVSCHCTWTDATPLQVCVLNRDFVDKNFDQLRGVFTLGEKQKDTEEKLAKAKERCQVERDKLVGVKKQLVGEDGSGGKREELATLEKDYQDKFWVPVQKLKQEGKLAGALQGFMGSKLTSKTKILQEHASNTATLKPHEELEHRAATVFGETPVKQPDVERLDTSKLIGHESNPILAKRVIGKGDVDIAAVIQKLGNSDWVRQGVKYYQVNEKHCPFCQQATTDDLATSLANYFDETFEKDSQAISAVFAAYERDAKALGAHLDAMLAGASKFLDLESLKAAKAALDQAVAANQLRLENKKKEPSAAIELTTLRPAIAKVKRIIHAERVLTHRHNQLVDNLAAEKKALTSDVWRYVLNELAVDLDQYMQKKDAIEKAIAGLENNKAQLESKIETEEQVVRELERQATSIQPTINAINRLLSGFGFESFKLAKADDGKHYKLVRQDGADARPTLSEGEKTFVVFLYFYNLLKGSTAESGTTTDRVVVFDDPISSLDSDVLFIVSTLIKEVCKAARSGTGNIKQVFVLTHNVYFHRQVTFDPDRPSNGCRSDESFWIVRKRESQSRVERCKNNPIKSSYELLWQEVRLAHAGKQVDPNLLRRILEHYFTMLGSHARINEVLDLFDGQDKVVAADLLSFLHAGSHSVFDDAYMNPSSTTPESYLGIFKQIFDRTRHGAHYQMMIGPIAATPTTAASA